MELPNYFLADLPDISTVTPQLVADACAALKNNREKFLLPRSTDSLIDVLARFGREWREQDHPLRQAVLQDGPEHTGFSRETLAHGLEQFFSMLTRQNLQRLIVQDLGHPSRLDEFVSSQTEMQTERAALVRGPELVAHIAGGTLPNSIFTSMVLGVLARSAQFVKCARGASFLPRMFAHSLYLAEPKLASCLEVAEWKGGDEAIESALFQAADCVTANGSDEVLEKIRQRLPITCRFLGYGHKLSFGLVTREMLNRLEISAVVDSAADDVVAWNQLGCLSPHVIYVESGGSVAPHVFAESLAKELARREELAPRSKISEGEAGAITARRMLYQVRSAAGEGTKIWQSDGSSAWTVVYEDDPNFQTSCLNRFIFVKAIGSLGQLHDATASVHRHLSTIGLSASPKRVKEIARELSKWGASRICRLGQMQNPPLTWRHDGRPSLADLVTWTDLEF